MISVVIVIIKNIATVIMLIYVIIIMTYIWYYVIVITKYIATFIMLIPVIVVFASAVIVTITSVVNCHHAGFNDRL